MCMCNAEMVPRAEHPGSRARGRGTAQGKGRRPVAWLRIVGAAARGGHRGISEWAPLAREILMEDQVSF